MRFRHIIRPIRTMLVAGAVLCAGPAPAQNLLRLSLDSRIDGQSTPFLIAVDRGYYQAEGLDVAVDPATTPLDALTRVANGTYDLAIVDINTLIKYRDQNPSTPLKAVFMVYNRPPFSIIARKSHGISQPKDIEGKKLGAPAADGSFGQWKVFVNANGIDAAKVTIENVTFPVREPILAAGQVDAITAPSFTYVDLKDRGVPVNDLVVLLMADHGVDLYGNAIVVSSKFAAERPEALRGFLHALVRGLKETVKDPGHAVESVLRRSEGARKEIELERLRIAIRDNILTEEVRSNGYGGIDQQRFGTAIDQLGLAYEFKSKPKAADIFDPAFLPSASERRAN